MSLQKNLRKSSAPGWSEIRPHLRPGSLRSVGQRIEFVLEDNITSIQVPNELVDVLSLCTGHFTVRQIVEKVYLKYGTVPFRSIFDLIIDLQRRGFLLNGEARNWNESHEKLKYFFPNSLADLWSKPFELRILLRGQRLKLAYVLSMASILFAVGGLGVYPLPFEEYFLEGTHVGPIHFFFDLMVATNLTYLILSVFHLTFFGRILSFRAYFGIFGFYFRPDEPSYGLVREKLFRILYHLGFMSIPWSLLVLCQFIEPSGFFLGIEAALCVLGVFLLNPLNSGPMKSLLGEIFMVRRSSDDEAHAHIGLRVIRWFWVGACMIIGYSWLREVLSQGNFSEPSSIHLYATLILSFFVEAVYTFVLKDLSSAVKRWLHHPWRARKYQSFSGAVDDVVERISEQPLFSYFSDQMLQNIVAQSELRNYEPKAHIIKEGDEPTEIFVLLSGEARRVRMQASSGLVDIDELSAPSVFGEKALLHSGKRRSDIVTQAGAQVLVVPVEAIERAAEEFHSQREFEACLNSILVQQYFLVSPIFRRASEEVRHLITMKSKIVPIEKKKVIFRQGDIGTDFFMILKGSVDIIVNDHQIDVISGGGFFGEIALIADVPRTATVATHEDCIFLRLPKDAFWEAICMNLDIALLIEELSTKRIKQDVAILGGLPGAKGQKKEPA